MKTIITAILSINLTACAHALQYISPEKSIQHCNLKWESLGKTSGYLKKHTPQGMEFIGDSLFLAISQNDKKTIIQKIVIDNKSYTISSEFEMPSLAVHTSGLAWDDNHLWAVDYVSKMIYKIDIDASEKKGKAVILGQYNTGSEGAGSIAIIRFKGVKSIAVTDFMNTGRTYIIPITEISNINKSKEIKSYKNAFFNQGIKYYKNYLIESHNALGRDIIYAINPEKAIDNDDYKSGIAFSFNAPNNMVEDVAFHDGYIFTSDESTYQIYYAKLLQPCI